MAGSLALPNPLHMLVGVLLLTVVTANRVMTRDDVSDNLVEEMSDTSRRGAMTGDASDNITGKDVSDNNLAEEMMADTNQRMGVMTSGDVSDNNLVEEMADGLGGPPVYTCGRSGGIVTKKVFCCPIREHKGKPDGHCTISTITGCRITQPYGFPSYPVSCPDVNMEWTPGGGLVDGAFCSVVSTTSEWSDPPGYALDCQYPSVQAPKLRYRPPRYCTDNADVARHIAKLKWYFRDPVSCYANPDAIKQKGCEGDKCRCMKKKSAEHSTPFYCPLLNDPTEKWSWGDNFGPWCKKVEGKKLGFFLPGRPEEHTRYICF